MDAFLAPFKNHERTGVPSGAGTAHGTDGFDLSRMHRLLKALGDPHLGGYQVIHVAGTKGKGSTVGFLAGVLRAAGHNTGTYKSPHVHSVSERIVCGPIGEGETGCGTDGHSLATGAAVDEDVAETIHRTHESEGSTLTYFEILTALAFLRFKQLGVQCAVVEVGMGGTLDATNVFPPEQLAAAIITAIGSDHWDALGGSLSHIVYAKCGIIRPHRPVFLAPQTSLDAEALLLSCAYESLGRIIGEWDVEVTATPRGVAWGQDGRVEQLVDFTITSEDDADGGSHSGNFVSRTLKDVRMSLLGPHQRDNARTALAVLEFLRKGGGQGPDDCDGGEGWTITDDDMRRGLEAAESPGCFETIVAPHSLCSGGGISGGPICAVMADGAHTRESAAAALATLSEVFPGRPAAVVVAMAVDKDHEGFLAEVMAARPVAVVLTQVPISGGGERTMPAGKLMAVWREVMMETEGDVAGTKGATSGQSGTTVLEVDELGEAISQAAAMVSQVSTGDVDEGVVFVTGSLNTVSRARAWAAQRGYIEPSQKMSRSQQHV